ncbi:MAG: serine/threonine-protein kinase, partial [Rhodothermales bacterium]
MTSDRWLQIQAVFQEALEHEPPQRAAFLDEACRENPDLRAEVVALLEADAQAGTFLEDTPLPRPEAPEATPFEGRQIGPYRLIHELGQGGMGAVYLAERTDGHFQQQVAIKLVRSDRGGRAIRQRFRYERQILARLNHPNIARLYDGGVTDEGLPYLVMEYVDGLPIDTYCDTHRLSTRERLHLFHTVGTAVQYAHQNLVVHRDLKPSNILVTETGTVKLLDFGIAKLLDEEATQSDEVPLTRTGMRVMTPEYASPEQVRGEPITTAADVYALGVILYELLTGHRPYQIRGLSLGETERVICEEEPARPSTAV